MKNNIQLTKHEKKTFESQTLQISGNAYFNCTFTNCTLIFTNSPVVLNGCQFKNCNWRIEYDILWGAPQSLMNLKNLVDKISQSAKDYSSSDMH